MKIGKLPLLTVTLWVCVTAAASAQVKVGDLFPDWADGYLDIHHIYTGRGECMFAILPDGTTMMIDAGETGSDKRNFKPDSTRSAGEWISRYIVRMMRPLSEKKLDYMLLTHFHDDHMGNVLLSNKKSDKGDYILTGISEVGDLIPFVKIVDRNWPDYNYPYPMNGKPNIQNYIRFVNWHVTNGAIAEQFEAGSNQQFKLTRQPDQYPGFEIRNIAANGRVWTGTDDNSRSHFPPIDQLTEEEYPEENACSAAIRISYGNFEYFNGADLVHTYSPGTWKDIETPVGQATGTVDVCVANHHAKDAMGEGFIREVTPRVFVIQGFALSHPDAPALRNMLSQALYAGERDIFVTNLFDVNRVALGEQMVSQLKSTQGHIVIRVKPGGESYQLYILDDSSESFTITAIHGPYESR
ncbi:MAG: MBL fold metallo-hydrolase [Proteiniphilum sp.]|nr:MBL fold metallo-hydrolase [Proteiniphilum sp.]MDD4486703.1 MBL fold metallo-hydrolase [Proteiniphilum sp.]